MLLPRYALHGNENPDLDCFFSVQFKVSRFLVYRAICDVLKKNGRTTEATACFQEMQSELGGDTGIHDERTQWEFGG